MSKIPSKIKARIFLVGCPRSGTTLLQSLLAAHPQIVSFPETNFFNMISDQRIYLGISSLKQRERKRIEAFLREVEAPDLQKLLPRISPFYKKYIEVFIEILDRLALERQAEIWLEKTPSHLYRIELIQQHVKDVKFIHIIRNGQDVVASLYDVTHKYPQIWQGEYSIDMCIDRWNKDVKISNIYISQENHLLVRYESLTEHPEKILIAICKFLKIEFSKVMLQNYKFVAKQLITSDEFWKRDVTQAIQNANTTKFYQLFDKTERDYILRRLTRDLE